MKNSKKSNNELLGDDRFKTRTTKTSATRNTLNTRGIYPCKRCNRKLKSELSLLKHQEMHDKKDNEERSYECNICNKGNINILAYFKL